MSFMISKIPSKSLLPSLFRRTLCTAAVESGAKNLERLANELLDLNKYERDDFNVLIRHKMGLNHYGPAPTGPAPEAAPLPVVGPSAAPAAAAAKEKTAFDVKLEKFDAASKLKVIKEIRAFTDLGLKDAKDLVEKTPSVVKKGVTKEEGLKIVEKLKELGATVVLE